MTRRLPRAAVPVVLVVAAVALAVVGTLLAIPANATPATAGPVSSQGTWSPRDSTVFNYPLSPRRRDHYRIRNTIIHAIKNSPAGSSINLTTFTFIDDHIADALLAAVRRGVSVQMLVNSKNSAFSEPLNRYRAGLKKIRKHLKRSTGRGGPSFVRICQHSCRGRFGNLHTKIYLFSQVATAQYVSMVSSANLTDFAAVGQWNHLDTVVDQATYAQLLSVFDAMRLRKPQPFRAFRTTKLDAWVFPRMGTTAATDPMIKQIKRVGCTLPASTPGGAPRRAVIRIAMYAWFDTRGIALAKAVRQKWNQGCGIKIIYSIMNWQSLQILRNPAGRGMIPMRRDVTLNGLGDVVDYNHSKYVALNGTFNGQPAKVVWSGSMNFTQLGIRSDDIIVRMSGQRVLRDYLTNFGRVWNGPAITMPPHVNAPAKTTKKHKTKKS
ncbi:phospholipase D-like domain-containing protein [Nocardioides mangrovicus]|uniref:phospholipase D-like domain-containing protein n=1 Tax=Nocardioides mangrovicus TaxID=2478913 RepID=UPI001314E8FE|nr:phospholipase D-like domain-containing protein [Nocardioides mangrovicus]